MSADIYSVKVNRRDGVVEITGSDKAWIAEQLAKLAPVYEGHPLPAPQDQGTSTQQEEQRSTHTKSRSRKNSGRPSGKASLDHDLKGKLNRELRQKLETYVAEREASFANGSQQEQATIIATFLQDELNTDRIGPNALYTVYSVMGWSTPGNPRAVINNARSRNGYFGGWSDGEAQLTHAGENFGRHGSLGGATT